MIFTLMMIFWTFSWITIVKILIGPSYRLLGSYRCKRFTPFLLKIEVLNDASFFCLFSWSLYWVYFLTCWCVLVSCYSCWFGYSNKPRIYKPCIWSVSILDLNLLAICKWWQISIGSFLYCMTPNSHICKPHTYSLWRRNNSLMVAFLLIFNHSHPYVEINRFLEEDQLIQSIPNKGLRCPKCSFDPSLES